MPSQEISTDIFFLELDKVDIKFIWKKNQANTTNTTNTIITTNTLETEHNELGLVGKLFQLYMK